MTDVELVESPALFNIQCSRARAVPMVNLCVSCQQTSCKPTCHGLLSSKPLGACGLSAWPLW